MSRKGYRTPSDQMSTHKEIVELLIVQNLPKAAWRVYFILKQRAVISSIKGKKGKKEYIVSNNGKIVFPYKEAQNKYGMSPATFAKAIDCLISCGLIFIGHVGGGCDGDVSTYGFSDEWRNYGTEKFKVIPRPKDSRGFGFTSDNWEARTNRKRSEVTQSIKTK